MTFLKLQRSITRQQSVWNAWFLCCTSILCCCTMKDLTTSQYIWTGGCFAVIIFCGDCIAPASCYDNDMRTRLSAKWYLLLCCFKFAIKLNQKAATYADESTCCKSRHGTATPGSNIAKQQRNSQEAITNNWFLQFYYVSFGSSP